MPVLYAVSHLDIKGDRVITKHNTSSFAELSAVVAARNNNTSLSRVSKQQTGVCWFESRSTPCRTTVCSELGRGCWNSAYRAGLTSSGPSKVALAPRQLKHAAWRVTAIRSRKRSCEQSNVSHKQLERDLEGLNETLSFVIRLRMIHRTARMANTVSETELCEGWTVVIWHQLLPRWKKT